MRLFLNHRYGDVTKCAYNRSVHSTTNYLPFEIVYGFNPSTSLDLILLPVDERVSLDGTQKAQVVKDLHAKILQ